MPESTDDGTTLGRYTLLARIGQGGMAEIYLARQAGPRGFERLCALKIMKEMSAGGEEHYDMFLDEARIAAQLSHPNIVQIFDFGEEEGRLFIAMEYLAGETLGAVLRRIGRGEAFPIPFAAYVISAAAGALAYAHGCKDVAGRPMNIVHRDISPDNLFITYDGTVKVLDFGIAKASMRSAQTAAGLVKGKIGYMAPEQLQGRELDGRTDVFALGMVLFEALCGQHPFEKKTQPAVEYLTGKLEAPLARSINPGVPQELEEIITGAIARDRDDRIHSALELQRMLESWLKTQEGVTPAALAGWMQEMFKARLAERNKLLEQALHAPVASRPNLPAAPPEQPAPINTRPDIDALPEIQAVSAPLTGGTGEHRAVAREVTAPAADAPLLDAEPVQEPPTMSPGQSASTVIARLPEGPDSDAGQSQSTVRASAPSEPGQSEFTVRATLPDVPPPDSNDARADAPAPLVPSAAMQGDEVVRTEVKKDGQPDVAARPPERSLTDDEISAAVAKPRWPIFGAIGAVVLVLGGGAFLLSRGGPEPKPVAKPAEAPPAPALAKLTVGSTPDHASISVDGALKGASPLQLELSAGKHVLLAHLEGFSDTQQEVEAKAGEAANVQLVLPALPKAADGELGMDFSEPEEKGAPKQDKKPKAAAHAAAAPKAARAPGKLTLDSVPWSTVYEGNQKLGDTPLFEVALPAGSHTLRLVNGPAKLEKKVTVSIKAGQVTAKRVNLK